MLRARQDTMQNLAHELDLQDRALEAMRAYEALIASGMADMDDYLNLAVMYLSVGPGYPSGPVPPEVYNRAWEGSLQLPILAQARFGDRPAILFWRTYNHFICGDGKPPNEDQCLLWLDSGETLEPAFCLVSAAGLAASQRRAAAYEPLARQLRTHVAGGETQRKRYIRSVLDASLRRDRVHDPKQLRERRYPFELLTEEQKALLLIIIGTYAQRLLPLAEMVNVAPLTLYQRNQLRDQLIDEFLASGLRDDWEPNEYGLQVDDIIAALGP